MLTDLTEEISREVFVNAEGSPLLLGNAGESGGEGSLLFLLGDVVSLLFLFLIRGDATVHAISKRRTLEAEAKAEANARLRPSLNMIIR